MKEKVIILALLLFPNSVFVAHGSAPEPTPGHLESDNLSEAQKLIDAAKKADSAALSRLLRSVKDVDVESSGGRTPLGWAVWAGSPECVDILIKAGANVNHLDKNGENPLFFFPACSGDDGTQCAKLLLSAGINVNIQSKKNGNTALMKACESENLDIYKLLLTKTNLKLRRNDGKSIHEIAAIQDAKHNKAGDKQGGGKYSKPLACLLNTEQKNEHPKKEIKKQRSEAEKALDADLRRACKRGEIKEALDLVKAGADVSIAEKPIVRHYNGRKYTLLNYICKDEFDSDYELLSKIKILVNAGYDVNTVSDPEDLKTTALHALCSSFDRPKEKCILFLLEHGADINKKDSQGRTPLMAAALLAPERIIKVLLDYGADLKSTDRYGNDAQYYLDMRNEYIKRGREPGDLWREMNQAAADEKEGKSN